MKKIISVLLSIIMLLSLCAGAVAVHAEDGYVAVNTYSGSFTVPGERIGPSSDRVPNQGAYFNAASAFNKISLPRLRSQVPRFIRKNLLRIKTRMRRSSSIWARILKREITLSALR